MGSPATISRQPDFWSEFIELTHQSSNGRVILEFLLERLVSDLGARGAALYFEQEGKLERQVSVGGDLLPVRLDPSAGEDPQALRVPGGLVRFRMPDDRGVALPPATAATLATAATAFLLSERIKRQRFEVNYRGVELEALYDVGLAIASTLNLEELSEEVLLRAVSLLDARRGALYLLEDDHFVLNRTFGGEARERVPCGSSEIEALLRSETSGTRDLMPGARHLLAVPIETENRRQGLLVVGDKESRQGVGPFGPGDRRTLSLFANQAAIAIQNAHLHRQALEKERLEREAELAADIQRRLLPDSVPDLHGFEIAGWNRPARLVGGDYYNFFPLREGRMAFLVADVTGKGMPAALMVSTLHSALLLLIERQPLDADLIAGLNHHIWESTAPNKFITLFLGVVEPLTGRLHYVSAGHTPTLLLRGDGEILQLGAAGMPLGLFERSQYAFGTVELRPTDLLCAYSDGITECESPQEDEFGTGGLTALLRQQSQRALDEIIAAVDAAVLDFAGGRTQGDDQTVLLIRRVG
jgi:sigma-B regulation protein RsbU (phosphoserine phosphatase)